jgi:hypothetical protein
MALLTMAVMVKTVMPEARSAVGAMSPCDAAGK